MRTINLGVVASVYRITASAFVLAGCLIIPAGAATTLNGDHSILATLHENGNLGVSGGVTVGGYAEFSNDVGVVGNLDLAGNVWSVGGFNFGWTAWDSTIPGASMRFLSSGERTVAFDVTESAGSFLWRDNTGGDPKTKMKLGTDNSLSLYSSGTAMITLKGGSGQIHLTGTGSGIYAGGTSVFSVGSTGAIAWDRPLGITSTTASTSSTTGALTVAGGLGVAADSFINGIRIGKGTSTHPAVRGSSTVLGVDALSVNATGSNNTAVGRGGLQANVSGSNNTALGLNALNENTSGENNTATGFTALQKNLTGSYNSAYGNIALNANTSGINNSAFGGIALALNTTGAESSALGFGALYNNTTGAKNTSIGAYSLALNNVGQSNIGLGWSAGRYQADGTTPLNHAENSIYIGANSKGFSNDDANSIVIGDSAVGEGANTTVIGNENTTSTRLFGEAKLEALRVSGKVILEEPQGDISMGIYE